MGAPFSRATAWLQTYTNKTILSLWRLWENAFLHTRHLFCFPLLIADNSHVCSAKKDKKRTCVFVWDSKRMRFLTLVVPTENHSQKPAFVVQVSNKKKKHPSFSSVSFTQTCRHGETLNVVSSEECLTLHCAEIRFVIQRFHIQRGATNHVPARPRSVYSVYCARMGTHNYFLQNFEWFCSDSVEWVYVSVRTSISLQVKCEFPWLWHQSVPPRPHPFPFILFFFNYV